MKISNHMEDLIPQRPPFVLVDQLISCNDQFMESTFLIPEEHPLVNNGRLCEGGLIENIAQTAAAGNGYSAREKGEELPNGFIAQIKNLHVKRLPKTNKQLITRVILQDRIMGYNLISGEIFEGGEIIASCGMKIYCP